MTRIDLPSSRSGQAHVVVLSPHCDDAAFSAAGVIGHFLESKTRVTVVTCFSVSAYAPHLLFRSRSRVSRIRQREDEAFRARCASTCELVWLGFEDAALRVDHSRDDICTARPASAGDLSLTADLAKRFAALAATADAVFLPLGLGFHVDHRIVREAGLALAADAGTKIYLYEELPYAATFTVEAINTWVASFAHARGFLLEPRYVTFRGLLEHKVRAARCYPSQLGGTVAERIAHHACRLGTTGDAAERVWQLSYARTRQAADAALSCRAG